MAIKTKVKQTQFEPVDLSPVKSFFVSMLTRDISLHESILDLLDNCVDGVLRTIKKNRGQKNNYDGFWAEIKYDGSSFSISDNCGGIPWNLHEYAFHMGRPKGRPNDASGSVGVYGIGMKRAIFKIGTQCLISTQNEKHCYELEITPAWIDDEENWKIPVQKAKKSMKKDGTTIIIGKLHNDIASHFGDDVKAFTTDLEKMVQTHYAFIIAKGFSVKINGITVKPRPTELVFAKSKDKKSKIQPFIFKTKTVEGVEVFLAVGFTRPIPSQEEITKEQETKQYSTLDAGWTVLCNDRAVLYCDRSYLTGWGEAGVPRYHTQFIAISGIVEFRSSDASKLPTTTTKRGIDASSLLYIQIKNKMREGMEIFTNYTNKWKGRADEAKHHVLAAGDPISLEKIKIESKKVRFNTTTHTVIKGQQFKPNLPMPKKIESQKRRISFIKDKKEIYRVGEYLFDDRNTDPSEVGEKCFDLIHRESKK